MVADSQPDVTSVDRPDPARRARRDWVPADGPLPAMYLGHGAPPLLDDKLWTGQLAEWAAGIPTPRAILVISAHWEAAPLSLSSTAASTPVVYDFWGFAQRYYQMTYPTPDGSALADDVAAVLPDGQDMHVHRSRGLDHGAWVPLKVMYPEADVPALQLSLPTSDPDRLLDLGRRLRPLREQGVLIIGSGFLTHGLPFLRREDWRPDASPPGWSRDFDEWAAAALDRADIDELAGFRSNAPGMPYAHPTTEHFVPLFVTLGTAADITVPPRTKIDGYWMGLAKRSVEVR